MKARVGIREIAEAAGVSITTVSHALNGKGRLQPATRERVRKIAERLNYSPSSTARNLVEGRTGVLALIVSQAEGELPQASDFAYFTRLMSGASIAAIERGYALVLAPSWGLRLHVDGAIIVDPLADDPLALELHRSGLPVVTTGRILADESFVNWVDNDHPAGARALLEHLRRRGATRVALITSAEVMSYTVDVEKTFRAWCDARLVKPIIVHTSDLTEGAGFAAAHELLERSDPPDAIYTTYDRLAYGALLAARTGGVSVPEDLLVASSATESKRPSRVQPSLTVLNLYPVEIGRRAAQLLIDLIEGSGAGGVERLVPTRVVQRASTRARRAAPR